MRLERLTWEDAQAYFEKRDSVLLSIGSIECHGRHLPLGTDTLIPIKLLELIEKRIDILIAPTLPYGHCESQTGYAGTLSIDQETLYAALLQLCLGLKKHGARHFLFLNGHGGNIPVLDRLSLTLAKKGCLMAELNWWLMAGDLDERFRGGHGGAEETAGVLAVDETLVHWDRVEDMRLIPLSDRLPSTGFKTVGFEGLNIPVPRPVPQISENGWIGPDHPKTAEKAWGDEMLTAVSDYIARLIPVFETAPLPQEE